MSSVDSVIEVDKFSEWLNLQTSTSKKCLSKQLTDWKSDGNKLLLLSQRFKRFQKAFQTDPTFFGKCHDIFREISEIEQRLQHLTQTESALEKESYSELLFFRPILQPLNFIPFLLTTWTFLRVYLLPGFSFMIPFLTLLAPYLILKFVFKLPMTLHNYMNILHSMASGDFTNGLGGGEASSTSFSPIMLLKKFGFLLITFVQGIIQPYWSYKHLKAIDHIVLDNGHLVLRCKELYEQLQTILESHGFTFFRCPLPPIANEREAMARVLLDTSYFKIALKYIGSLEVMMSLANKQEMHPVYWIQSDKPIYRIQDTFDFQVPIKSRKTISASFDKQRHALLTGPNKGGKSTVLRALSTSALLAHTYGCAFGKATMTPFRNMFVCLKPDDLPGSKSRFEREIEFTANTLLEKEPILVLIDELYHSTNPPDALRSCQIYCNQLWKKSNVISVISTHLFELVESSKSTIQRLCCPATIDDKGVIQFEYCLNKGICKVSSVDELLRKNGLLSAPESGFKIPKARQNDIPQ